MPQLAQTRLGAFWVWPDSVGRDLLAGGFWDEHLRPALDAADPAGWALDLGASIGWFSVYLAQRHPRVIAVEAHPTTYQLLLDNLARNKTLGRVFPYWGAAYADCRTLWMATEAEMGWTLPSQIDLDGAVCASGVAFRPDPNSASQVTVPAFPVDRLIPADAPVSLIKIDVQGCDLQAIRGLEQTITRCRPPVLFEYEAVSELWHHDPYAAYLHWFTEHNYRVTQIRPDFADFLAVPR